MSRTLIQDTVRAVVLQPQADAQTVLDITLSARLVVDMPEHQALRALIADELRRLHEGMLAREASTKLGKMRRVYSFDSC